MCRSVYGRSGSFGTPRNPTPRKNLSSTPRHNSDQQQQQQQAGTPRSKMVNNLRSITTSASAAERNNAQQQQQARSTSRSSPVPQLDALATLSLTGDDGPMQNLGKLEQMFRVRRSSLAHAVVSSSFFCFLSFFCFRFCFAFFMVHSLSRWLASAGHVLEFAVAVCDENELRVRTVVFDGCRVACSEAPCSFCSPLCRTLPTLHYCVTEITFFFAVVLLICLVCLYWYWFNCCCPCRC